MIKRLVLTAILIFPILSLVGWLIWGATREKNLPTASESSNNIPALNTNATGVQTGSPPAE